MGLLMREIIVENMGKRGGGEGREKKGEIEIGVIEAR